jgi:hypothetical protein
VGRKRHFSGGAGAQNTALSQHQDDHDRNSARSAVWSSLFSISSRSRFALDFFDAPGGTVREFAVNIGGNREIQRLCHHRDVILVSYARGGPWRFNPAASVRGPRYVVKRGKTPVRSFEEARKLLN